MKITQEEFYQLENFRLELKICGLEAENLSVQRRNKALAKRVLELEDATLISKVGENKNKKQNIMGKYQQLRSKISERLDIKTLDEYLIDDVTLEVFHQDDVEDRLTEQRLNALTNN